MPFTIRALAGSQLPRPDSQHRYRCKKLDSAGTLEGTTAQPWRGADQLIPATLCSHNMSFFSHAHTNSFVFRQGRLFMMRRPLRYKSKKCSTCNIRSSNFPLSQFLQTIKRSVRSNTFLATALVPSPLSSTANTLRTFHASNIVRPAASLSIYSP